MYVLYVSLFGKFQVRCHEEDSPGFDARKVQELFCYLLLHRSSPHPRETLASLLWDNCSTVQSKKYLRQALWRLQVALDSQTNSNDGQMLLIEPNWVRLNPEANIWLDVQVFEHAIASVQRVPSHTLDLQSVQTLQEAAQLYRGELLEGWYQDWCLYERERLQNMYLATLDKLTAYHEFHGQYEDGLHYGTCALRYDIAQERIHRRLMRLHYLNGNRTMALRQYERCVSALQEELGVSPSKRTRSLYEQIRSDQFDGLVQGAHVNPALERGFTSLTEEVMGRLEHLQAVLVEIQGQLHQERQLVEQALNGRR